MLFSLISIPSLSDSSSVNSLSVNIGAVELVGDLLSLSSLSIDPERADIGESDLDLEGPAADTGSRFGEGDAEDRGEEPLDEGIVAVR